MKNIKRFRLSIGTIAAWLLLVVIVGAIVIMGVLKEKEEVLETIETKSVLVRTVKMTLQSIQDRVVLPGRVEADVSVRLATEKGGRVIALEADRGDFVKAGDMLLRIDDRHWGVLQKRASIEFADAKRDLERWEKLRDEGAVSSSEYDAVQRRFSLAEVAVEEARVHMDQCRVVSPIDGVVDGRYVELGEYVGEATLVFKVVSMEKLEVVLNVPEKDINAAKIGRTFAVSSRALQSDAGFMGKVGFVAVDGDSRANTFSVELEIENPPQGLKPGMIVDVDLLRSARDNVIVVPFSAVVPKRGEHVVFVVEGSNAVLKVVHVDAIVGQKAILSSGLTEGDLLVVEGQRTLQDGVWVRQ